MARRIKVKRREGGEGGNRGGGKVVTGKEIRSEEGMEGEEVTDKKRNEDRRRRNGKDVRETEDVEDEGTRKEEQ